MARKAAKGGARLPLHAVGYVITLLSSLQTDTCKASTQSPRLLEDR